MGDEGPAPVLTWEEFDEEAPEPSATYEYARPADRQPPRRRARWHRLLARRDLVDKHLAARPPPDRTSVEQSPRSSFDFDEPRSLTSWGEEPPSPTLRSWRSGSSRSYKPRQEDAPRPIGAIGRQSCMNDISDIIDRANSPCYSYDRQLFDPETKMWRYVEADEPTSSPWELGPSSLGSPMTTSASSSATTPATSSGAPASAPSLPTPSQRQLQRFDSQPFQTIPRRNRLFGRSPAGRPRSPLPIGRRSSGPRSAASLRSDEADLSTGSSKYDEARMPSWGSRVAPTRPSLDRLVTSRDR